MAKEGKIFTEAARGACLAVHSAATLALAQSREAARLLRAAEGLCRAAVAVLGAAPTVRKDTAPAAPAAGEPGKGTSRSARRRRRQAASAAMAARGGCVSSQEGGKGEAQDAGVTVDTMELDDGSVVVGDLSELYLGASSTRVGGRPCREAAEAPGGLRQREKHLLAASGGGHTRSRSGGRAGGRGRP